MSSTREPSGHRAGRELYQRFRSGRTKQPKQPEVIVDLVSSDEEELSVAIVPLSPPVKETPQPAPKKPCEITPSNKNVTDDLLRLSPAKELSKQPPSKKRKYVEVDISSSDDESFQEPLPKIRKVSVALLDSLPGDRNRFKRVELDEGEDPNLWKICLRDQFPAYFANRTGRKKKCLKCKDFTDHETRDCPIYKGSSIVCFICCRFGHFGEQCKKSICSKCRREANPNYICPNLCTFMQCPNCNASAHEEAFCPEKWRRYHLTTHSSQVAKMMPISLKEDNKWCYNCGGSEHFGFECYGRRGGSRSRHMTLPPPTFLPMRTRTPTATATSSNQFPPDGHLTSKSLTQAVDVSEETGRGDPPHPNTSAKNPKPLKRYLPYGLPPQDLDSITNTLPPMAELASLYYPF